jgi:hypothetical protein
MKKRRADAGLVVEYLENIRQEIQRHVIGTENQNSASYADPSNYC